MEGKINDRSSNEMRAMVKNWGVSQSTLEEVFMKVIKFIYLVIYYIINR